MESGYGLSLRGILEVCARIIVRISAQSDDMKSDSLRCAYAFNIPCEQICEETEHLSKTEMLDYFLKRKQKRNYIQTKKVSAGLHLYANFVISLKADTDNVMAVPLRDGDTIWDRDHELGTSKHDPWTIWSFHLQLI